MAHLIDHSKGKAAMFYTGDKPWHELGTRLDKPANAAEAIKEAGLDYIVELHEIYAHVPVGSTIDGNGNIVNSKEVNMIRVPERFATVRTDTNGVLGDVGNVYTPIQNVDAFEFFDSIVDRDEAIYHTAGALDGGKRIWLLAKLPDYLRIGKDDTIEKYLLFTNSHDGTTTLVVMFTPIRVVCNNTLTFALQGNDSKVRIRHSEKAPEKLRQASELLGITNKLYEQLEVVGNQLASKKVNSKKVKEFLDTLLPIKDETKYIAKIVNKRNDIMKCFEQGAGSDLVTAKGTYWGLVNAVAEWTDHMKSVKGGSPEEKLKSIVFGNGADIKNNALKIALSMAKSN